MKKRNLWLATEFELRLKTTVGFGYEGGSNEKILEENRLNANTWRQLKKNLLRGITLPGEPVTCVGLTTNAISPLVKEHLSARATVVNKADTVLILLVLTFSGISSKVSLFSCLRGHQFISRLPRVKSEL